MKISYANGNKWLIAALYAIISLYVVYKQATDGNAVDLGRQEVRHQRMLDGDSEFFNPWQYRMFSTVVAEGFYRTLHGVVSSIERTESFLLFRFLQNLLIFFVADLFFRALHIRNPWLRLTGLLILAFSMAHSVFQSDLSFNTYFDILFYLLAAWLILEKRFVWIIPVTVLAAFNRETSAFIPVMLLITHMNLKEKTIPGSVLRIGVLSGIGFAIVFVSLRLYYGYPPAIGIHGMSSVQEYFLFNVKFFRMYPELVGTLAFLPIVVILYLKRLPDVLRKWFWLICPAWFVIHFAFTTAVETRLFLVPQALIFIPAFLILVENWYGDATSAWSRSENPGSTG